jgi:hypothetical protein
MTPKQQWHQTNVLSLTASRKLTFSGFCSQPDPFHLNPQEMRGRMKLNENNTPSGFFILAYLRILACSKIPLIKTISEY